MFKSNSYKLKLKTQSLTHDVINPTHHKFRVSIVSGIIGIQNIFIHDVDVYSSEDYETVEKLAHQMTWEEFAKRLGNLLKD